jgi:hypothetical protein
MPTNTYDALYTNTVTVATPTVTFNTLDQTYTDLVMVITGRCSNTSTGASISIRANSDSGTNYSQLSINASSASTLTERYANTTGFDAGRINTANGGNTNVGTSIINLQGYSNTTTFKTMLAQSAVTNEAWPVYEAVSTWRNTAAITSLTITCGYDFVVGTTFTIYGIRAEGVSPAPKATGGVVSSDSTYYYHTFASSGTFTPNQTISCDYFMVAGGGGAGATTGGGWAGGGGGAGGYRTFTSTSFTATAYAITVGGGGSGGSGSGGTGAKGGNSSVIGGAISTTTTGGGGGGTTEVNGSTKTNGQPGGSGGGGAQTQTSVSGGAGNEGGYTPVEGYAGRSTTNNPGQGGGAGGVGLDSVYGTVPTPNGVTAFNSNYYASGGYCLNVATGSQNALAFTGNGGSSRNDGTGANVAGGNGGSGIVVIRYAKA